MIFLCDISREPRRDGKHKCLSACITKNGMHQFFCCVDCEDKLTCKEHLDDKVQVTGEDKEEPYCLNLRHLFKANPSAKMLFILDKLIVEKCTYNDCDEKNKGNCGSCCRNDCFKVDHINSITNVSNHSQTNKPPTNAS